MIRDCQYRTLNRIYLNLYSSGKENFVLFSVISLVKLVHLMAVGSVLAWFIKLFVFGKFGVLIFISGVILPSADIWQIYFMMFK